MLFRIILVLVILISADGAFGQGSRKKSSFNASKAKVDPFLNKQWWLGIKAGANASQARLTQAYDVIIPVNYIFPPAETAYQSFNRPGWQVAIEAAFSTKSFSIAVQPAYRHSVLEFERQYE